MHPQTRHRPRDAQILPYLPLVRLLAKRMLRRAPWDLELDDLVSYGTLGLIDALDRYDAHRDASFHAYVRLRIQGAMLDEIRRHDLTPRSVHDRGELLRRTDATLTARLGRAPTASELAAQLEIPEARVHTLRAGAHVTTRVPLLREDEDREGGTVWLPDPAPGVEERIRRDEVFGAVRGGLLALSARDQVIVDLYYVREHTFKEIASMLGVTESRISQLHTALCARLAVVLEPDAIAA